jgi:uncharacterized protein
VAYAAYCTARDGGPGTQAEAGAILASISDYNEYDCLSTLRLRDWLLGLAHGPAVTPGQPQPAFPDGRERQDATAGTEPMATEPTAGEPSAGEPTAEEETLRGFLDAIPDTRGLTADEQAVAMVAAATGFHRRERKQFWWEHFDRLESEVDSWSDQRNVFVVEDASVVSDWAPPTRRARTESRTLRLTGVMSEGSEFRAGSTWFRMFQTPSRTASGKSTADARRGRRRQAQPRTPPQRSQWTGTASSARWLKPLKTTPTSPARPSSPSLRSRQARFHRTSSCPWH